MERSEKLRGKFTKTPKEDQSGRDFSFYLTPKRYHLKRNRLDNQLLLRKGGRANVFSRVKECTSLQCFAYGSVGICRVRYFGSVRDDLLSGI